MRQQLSALQSAVAGAAVVAALVGGAYGLQLGVLRTPSIGERTAARLDGMLARYRFLRSTIHVAGQPRLHAECLEGWQVTGGSRGSRGAQVLFTDGERLLLTRGRVQRLTPGTLPELLPPIAEVELAGCARSLTATIDAHLVEGRRTAALPGDFMGHAALVLHVRTRRDRIDLFVTRHTLLPLGVRVETHRAVGWSTVDPVRLTPPLEQSFRERFGR